MRREAEVLGLKSYKTLLETSCWFNDKNGDYMIIFKADMDIAILVLRSGTVNSHREPQCLELPRPDYIVYQEHEVHLITGMGLINQ